MNLNNPRPKPSSRGGGGGGRGRGRRGRKLGAGAVEPLQTDAVDVDVADDTEAAATGLAVTGIRIQQSQQDEAKSLIPTRRDSLVSSLPVSPQSLIPVLANPLPQPQQPQPASPKQRSAKQNNLCRRVIRKWRLFSTSATARRFNAKRLLKTALLTWRRARLLEWRRNIKASVHERMTLYLTSWNQWIHALHDRRILQQKIHKAQQFANATLLRTCTHHWLMYRDARRIQNIRKRFARASREGMLAHRLFRVWRARFHHRQRVVSMYQQAALADSTRRVRGGWRRWSTVWIRQKGWDVKVGKALRGKRRKVLQDCLRGWKEYADMRKQKTDMRDTASLFYARVLGTKALAHWKLRQDWRERVREMNHEADTFLGTTLTDGAFTVWKQRATMARQERGNLIIAEYHNEKQLKSIVLSHWSSVNVWMSSARAFDVKQTYKRAWKLWKFKAHTSLVAKEMQELEPGILQNKKRILIKCARAWTLFVALEKSERELEFKAVRFDRARILTNMFRFMRDRYALNSLKRRMESLAEENWRLNALSGLFIKLRDLCQERYWERVNIKKVERFRRLLLIRKYFDAIAKNADQEALDRENEQLATIHHNRVVALKALQGWRFVASTATQQALAKRTAVRVHYLGLLSRVLTRWMRSLARRQRERFLMQLAASRYERARALEMIRLWKKHVDDSKLFRAAVVRHQQVRQVVRLKGLFEAWRERLVKSTSEREAKAEIYRLRNLELLSKVMQAWQLFTSDRVIRRAEIDVQVSEVESALLISRARRCFKHWVIYHDMKSDKKLRAVTAQVFRLSRLTNRAFLRWSVRLRQRVWDKTNDAVADQHLAMVLSRKHMTHWMNQRPDWSRVHFEINMRPLLHWSRQLMQTSFRAWHHHAAQQKRLAQALKDAEGWRQELALRDGLAFWMLGADQLRRMRDGYRVAEALKTTRSEVDKVRRFAVRWRAKTLAARAARRAEAGMNAASSSEVFRMGAVDLALRKAPLAHESRGGDNFRQPLNELGGFPAQGYSFHASTSLESRTKRPAPRMPEFLQDLLREFNKK
ncbi:hypothetical protein BC830DRAFT_1145723 [Chytriomyces sp. MP71]|nr:hypothetical protein BC830DRAFT_1145723 [Chytriomyces sp. MP71]